MPLLNSLLILGMDQSEIKVYKVEIYLGPLSSIILFHCTEPAVKVLIRRFFGQSAWEASWMNCPAMDDWDHWRSFALQPCHLLNCFRRISSWSTCHIRCPRCHRRFSWWESGKSWWFLWVFQLAHTCFPWQRVFFRKCLVRRAKRLQKHASRIHTGY